VWDLGGVRYLAAGCPRRRIRCSNCSTTFTSELYRIGSGDSGSRAHDSTENDAVENAMSAPIQGGRGIQNGVTEATTRSSITSDCRLWIDGAGCYVVLTADAVTVGSPSSGPDRPDIAIMAPISRRQVQIVRLAEGFTLIPVGGGSGTSGRLLHSGDQFEIGGGVQLRLRIPNPLSQTAVLDIASSHRTEPRCNGVILLDQVCVLGPGADAHIRNPLWPEPLVLFRRNEALWCKATSGLQRNGVPAERELKLENGDVLTTEDLRLRIELSCGA
jgi:hypothetical protein